MTNFPIHLSDITLVSIAGSYEALSAAAVRDTLRNFLFDDILLWSNTQTMNCPGTWHQSDIHSNQDTGMVVNYEVFPLLLTKFALFIHWDGWATTPFMWSEDFREFDYIGAVWPWFTENTVGNSGFNLRSRRFLEAVYADRSIIAHDPEDILLCRNYRPRLEAVHGIKFADEATAARFSTEYWPNTTPTLGFHGVWHFLDHMTDAEAMARLEMLTPRQWTRPDIENMAFKAMLMDRRELYNWLVSRRLQAKAEIEK